MSRQSCMQVWPSLSKIHKTKPERKVDLDMNPPQIIEQTFQNKGT
jgi:hypothetical protein